MHWSQVFGLWSLVGGLWSLSTLVFGLWSLVSGLWSLVSGLWSLVFGLWTLVFGLWSLVSGLWSPTFLRKLFYEKLFWQIDLGLVAGLWSLISGLLLVVSGLSALWSLVSGLWSLANVFQNCLKNKFKNNFLVKHFFWTGLRSVVCALLLVVSGLSAGPGFNFLFGGHEYWSKALSFRGSFSVRWCLGEENWGNSWDKGGSTWNLNSK